MYVYSTPTTFVRTTLRIQQHDTRRACLTHYRCSVIGSPQCTGTHTDGRVVTPRRDPSVVAAAAASCICNGVVMVFTTSEQCSQPARRKTTGRDVTVPIRMQHIRVLFRHFAFL